MKVLFVLEHYSPYLGGAEKLFKQVAEGLAKAGHEVVVVTTLFRADLACEEQLNGVQIKRVKCYNRFLFTVFSLPSIWRAAKGADVIHTTTYNAAFPAWLIGRFRRKRVYLTFHEYWGKLWFRLPYLSFTGRWSFYLYEQFVLRLPFYHYIAVSKATQEGLIAGGVPGKRISQIYNGLNYERLKPYLTNQDRVGGASHFVYYGRLGVSKGLDLLLPAFAQLKEQYENVHLDLVIPTYPEGLFQIILQAIEDLGIIDAVQLHHELSEQELFTVVKNAHAVLIPSYSEGFCFVAAEAVALGIPIVSSGQTALQETVSGQYIEMESMSTKSLVHALQGAYAGEWDERPIRYFKLADSITAYIKLLQEG